MNKYELKTKVMETKYKAGNPKIFRTIVSKYIFGIPQTRILIFPVIISILFGKYLEVKVSEFNIQISEHLENSGINHWKIISTFLIMFVLSATFTELQGIFFTSAVQQSLRYALRNTFELFIKMEVKDFNSYGCGTIQTMINRKGKAVSDLIEVCILHVLPFLLTVLFSSFAMLKIIGIGTTLVANVFILLYVVVTVQIALWRNSIRVRLNKSENKASNSLYDSLSNHETVSCFNGHYTEVQKYDSVLADVEKHSVSLFGGLYLLNFLQKMIFSFFNAGILAMSLYQVFSKKMTVGEWTAFISLSRTLMAGLNNLGWTYCKFNESMINAKDAFSEEIEDGVVIGQEIYNFKNSIRFDNVYFSYANKAILKGTSFTINRGDKVALIGTNGAGKSTILKTLLKFNNYKGNIYIDDKNINTITQESFRRFVGYVPQNPSLFNNTVAYNIKYGNPTIPDYFIVNLAKKFQIHDSIMNLERGYLTQAGEGGKYLSGGERQRVAILRALVKESQILIMDEPTSNLDKESEYEIMSRIMSMSSELTVLAIVHNPELLTFFNKVCFLDQGVVKIYENFDIESISALMTNNKTSQMNTDSL